MRGMELTFRCVALSSKLKAIVRQGHKALRKRVAGEEVNSIAILWIIGILFLAVAFVGQKIKIMDNELPALTDRLTRIALGVTGVLALVLGGIVYFGGSGHRPDMPLAPTETAADAPETTHVSPKTDTPTVTPSDSGAPSDGADSIASWHMDEGEGPTVSDSSGDANNGTLAGSRTPTWIDGVSGAGLRFTRDSYVQVARSVTLEPRLISVQAWVRADNPPQPLMYILSKGANGCEGASYAIYTGFNGGLRFYVSPNGDHFVASPDAGVRIWDGRWHRIVGTYDESVVRLYVDGKEIGAGAAAAFPVGYSLPTSQDLYIGAYRGTCVESFDGDIDEIAIWDRPLGSREIASDG